jgi:hypothetical protein
MADEIYKIEVKKRSRTSGADVPRWVEVPVSDLIPERASLE